MLIVDRKTMEAELSMEECIPLMRNALVSLSTGDAKQIVRPVLHLYDKNVLGMMPAFSASRKVAGAKLLSVFPENYRKGLPSHQGQIVLFETETGAIKAIVDAEAITGIRTAAASAVATDALAGREASSVAILGAGLQGRQHLRAILRVRAIKTATIWDLRREAAELYAKEMQAETGVPITVCDNVHEATKQADIICTLTPSVHPILSLRDVKPGAHINAVGACTPNARELTTDLVKAGVLFADWKQAMVVEAGDYLFPLQEGEIDERHLAGELGAVLDGSLVGRPSPEAITIFEALGQALEDLVAADYVVEKMTHQ